MRYKVLQSLFPLALALLPGPMIGQTAPSCASCHSQIVQTFAKTGMGRSFQLPDAANLPRMDKPYFHPASSMYFQIEQRDGKYFQRAWQVDAQGQPANLTEKSIDYVMGSGNHARTYLSRSAANTLFELPLGWYAENGGYWAMNPGYDRADHPGFRRPITYDCMFCHNAYPKIPAGHEKPMAEAVYAGPLPLGIDCARCHGPGAKHAQVAATAGATVGQIRAAIANPARFSPEQQMETCMACHLESTSFPLPNALQRVERNAFSYQPGTPLGDFLVNFDHDSTAGRQNKFEIVNSVYRLRQSKCFLESQGRLLCTTCHNPHDIPRGEAAILQYDAACRKCHTAAFTRLVQNGKHTGQSDCASCHMPKRRTEDVIHVAATDHLIQKTKPAGDLLAPRPEIQDNYRGRVVLYYPENLPETPENALLRAVAQVVQESNLAEGIPQLQAALQKYQPKQPEYYLYLADALTANGQSEPALAAYRQAVLRGPDFAPALQKLGTALRKANQNAEAVSVLLRAAQRAPDRPLTWHELGLAYRAQRKIEEAVASIRQALRLDPDLPEANNNLGNILVEQGRPQDAEALFRAAIRARVQYVDAHGNLAALLAATGRSAEALQEFEIALRLRPEDGMLRYGYATQLGRGGRYDEALAELQKTTQSNPDLVDAQLLLGDLLMAKQQAGTAIPHYREALRVSPESGRGHFGLGAALLMTGDRESGIRELKLAASGNDAAAREQANSILRQLGNP